MARRFDEPETGGAGIRQESAGAQLTTRLGACGERAVSGVRLRVGTWNLQDGGLDHGGDARSWEQDEARLWEQVKTLAGEDLDLIGIQEATWGRCASRLLHDVAHQLGMVGRYLVPSNHHGCDLAMLVRERGGLRVLEERHDTSASWWHALGHLRLMVPAVGAVEFLNTHLAPSAPTRRAAEAEALGLFKRRPSILVGDFNARAARCDEPDTTNVDPGHAAAKLDRRAAVAMQAAGFVDVAAEVGRGGDHSPTVGHTASDRLAYRCDRILYNRLAVSVADYQVIPAVGAEGTHLSDHHLVVAELRLGDWAADDKGENSERGR